MKIAISYGKVRITGNGAILQQIISPAAYLESLLLAIRYLEKDIRVQIETAKANFNKR